tara:strand:- start:367 stop:969 length:603 start_codon:yes stop_codon:yes gene_type:complete
MSKWFLSLLCFVVLLPQGQAKTCTYGITQDDVKVEWTAFKTNDKVAVKGTFNKMTLNGATSASSLAALAQGLSIDIDGGSIESGNPGRNVTVKQFFFEKFVPAYAMQAKVVKFTGDEKSGSIDIALSLNGVSKTLAFAYTVKDNVLEAKASMQMFDFGLKAAFDSIHTTCKTLHTGKDGVAKTWDEVDLMVSGKFSKTCK